MKLYLKPSVSVLTLILTLSTSATLAMDAQDNTDQFTISLSSSPTSNKTSFAVANSSLFSQEELTNMEIGCAIIEDRIKQKKSILFDLANPDTLLIDKMLNCEQNFGVVPIVGSLIDSDAIEKGIAHYCDYTSFILHTYTLAQTCVHKIFASTTTEDKQYHQNNLYYLLSCDAKHHREYIKMRYTHAIPEHSIEDNFYEMICSKMCATATKKYDVLNEYFIFEFTANGAIKKIDNNRLVKIYNEKHADLQKAFQKNPIWWLASANTPYPKVNSQLSVLVEPHLESVNAQIKECGQNTLNITRAFAQHLDTYTETHPLNEDNDIITMYNICGPWILNTIQAYDNVTLTIKTIEKASIEWLKNFKTNSQLYRKLSLEQKTLITTYLQEQDRIQQEEKKRIELEKKQKLVQEAAARKAKRELQPQKKVEQKESLTPNLPKHKPEVVSGELELAAKELGQQSSDLSMPAPQKLNEAVVTSSIGSATASIGSATEELPQQERKVKVKTRPEKSVTPVIEATTENIPENARELPAQYRSDAFTYFIKDLVTEKNERSLQKLFKQLSSVYGIEAVTDEQQNKGFFAVRSPLTGQVHVRTYHHLHADNPYASIFIALRDVLRDANILD